MAINTRKKSGRPPVDSAEVSVRMPRAMLDRIDEFAKKQGLKGRPEAVRRLVQHSLDSYRSLRGQGSGIEQ